MKKATVLIAAALSYFTSQASDHYAQIVSDDGTTVWIGKGFFETASALSHLSPHEKIPVPFSASTIKKLDEIIKEKGKATLLPSEDAMIARMANASDYLNFSEDSPAYVNNLINKLISFGPDLHAMIKAKRSLLIGANQDRFMVGWFAKNMKNICTYIKEQGKTNDAFEPYALLMPDCESPSKLLKWFKENWRNMLSSEDDILEIVYDKVRYGKL